MAATLKDVARVAQLHISTVSRALRNDPRILPETCHRVQDVAQKLGYLPNPLVAALMAVRRGTGHFGRIMMACVSNLPEARIPGRHPWSDQVYQAVGERVEQLGFISEVFFLDQFGWSDHRLLKVLHARGFSGLIWAFAHNQPMPASPLLRHFSMVVIGNQSSDYSSVNADTARNMELAVANTLRLGYRRPGLILLGDLPEFAVNQMHAAFLFNTRHLPVKNQLPLLRLPESSSGAVWVKRHRPDVIISHVSSLALLGIDSVPYLTFDWMPQFHGQKPFYAGVNVCRRQTGRIAVDLVASHLYHNERGPGEHARHIQVPGVWVERPSETPPPSKPPRSRKG